MSLTDEERQVVVNLEYEKAKKFFSQAEKNVQIEQWDVVASYIVPTIYLVVSEKMLTFAHRMGKTLTQQDFYISYLNKRRTILFNC